ncbi:zinc-binding dehydrogenase [Streptomyces sp. NPDC058470]|uniref:zinc-binding dehydrogenase n=1 Tax=Streptomyces sp. NPDC058470 TaxID=3346515 RepID=UPI00365E803D
MHYRTDDLTTRIDEITGGRGVDLIYEPVGGDTAATALKSIARNGRIAMIGIASGAYVPLDSMGILLRNYTAVAVLATPHADPATEIAVWDRLANLAKQGAITTPVGTGYGFNEVPRMITELAAPGAGTSVVRVAPE